MVDEPQAQLTEEDSGLAREIATFGYGSSFAGGDKIMPAKQTAPTPSPPPAATGTSFLGKVEGILSSIFSSAASGKQSVGASPTAAVSRETPLPAYNDIPPGSTAAQARDITVANLENFGLTKKTAERFLDGDFNAAQAVNSAFKDSPAMKQGIEDVVKEYRSYAAPQGTTQSVTVQAAVAPTTPKL